MEDACECKALQNNQSIGKGRFLSRGGTEPAGDGRIDYYEFQELLRNS